MGRLNYNARSDLDQLLNESSVLQFSGSVGCSSNNGQFKKERVCIYSRTAGRMDELCIVASCAELSHGEVIQTVNVNQLIQDLVQHD